jgi:hypothetical protein
VTRVADQIIVLTLEKPAKEAVNLCAWNRARCFERDTGLADAAEEQWPIEVTGKRLHRSPQVGLNKSDGHAVVAHRYERVLLSSNVTAKGQAHA